MRMCKTWGGGVGGGEGENIYMLCRYGVLADTYGILDDGNLCI